MSTLTILLFIEYRFFKNQALHMITLKEDYQNHLLAVNRILQEYNKTKERLEQLETALDSKKKKIITMPAHDAIFPRGARVFSSDDEPSDEKDTFVAINRELEYLKQSSLKYLKKNKLDLVLQRINQSEAWGDYTEQLLQKDNQRPAGSRSKKRRRRTVYPNKRLQERAQERARKRQEYKNDICFSWPIERSNFWISSFFGPRKGPNGASFHYGIDMAAIRGTPVYPAADGVVVEARHAPGYGKTVVISHNRKYKTRYAHLHTINVQVGQNVTPHIMLGKVGSTGTVRSKKGDPSHLHFEVYVFGKKVNPMYFF